jgi:KDO2-lipid IV(A) lauroyltransferase
MSAIAFHIQYFFLKVIALLPFRVLYFVSDGLYYLLRYIVRYRLNVVRENIKLTLHEKSPVEQVRIEKAFYRHFADLLVESIKMIQLSPEELDKRIPILNPEMLDKYRDAGRSVLAVGAHYCNWEWTLGIVPHLKYTTIGVYKPLNNKHYDQLVKKNRSKFNTSMVSMKDVVRVLIKYRIEKVPTFSVFVADQSPIWNEVQYWLPFMNQNTAVYLGPEKLAKQFDMVVVFGKVKKTGRGKYSVELIPVEENPTKTGEHEITKKLFGMLEEFIREEPEYWLWSHRRWKLTRRREKEESQGVYRFSESNIRI